IYRYIPNTPGELAKGGKLQALALVDIVSADTRNWSGEVTIKSGRRYKVRWIDLDNVESPENDLRHRGFAAGAARFARGEGMWYSEGCVYFACTNGGVAELASCGSTPPDGPRASRRNRRTRECWNCL